MLLPAARLRVGPAVGDKGFGGLDRSAGCLKIHHLGGSTGDSVTDRSVINEE
jgi:hypothetical protein